MATAYPLSWPDGWPRTKTPIRSPFKAGLETALKNVERSLRMFASDSGRKVEGVVVSTNYSLTSRRPADPGVAVYFAWDGIDTCIAVDRYATIEGNMQAIHHVLEAERTKLRHGGLNVVRASFRGFAALPPPADDDPWRTLGVARGASRAEVDVAFRERAKAAHPDRGGSPDAMAALVRARDRALASC